MNDFRETPTTTGGPRATISRRFARKSFIERIAGAEAGDRLPGSLAAAALAVAQGAHVVRAHDVRATVQATRVVDRILRGEKL